MEMMMERPRTRYVVYENEDEVRTRKAAVAEMERKKRLQEAEAEAEKIKLQKAEEEKKKLQEAEAEKVKLQEAEAEKKKLQEAEAEKVKLQEAEAEKVKLQKAEEENKKLQEAEAEKVKLQEAEAEKVDLQEAKTKKVKLQEAEAEEIKLQEEVKALKKKLQEAMEERKKLQEAEEEEEKRLQAKTERERKRNWLLRIGGIIAVAMLSAVRNNRHQPSSSHSREQHEQPVKSSQKNQQRAKIEKCINKPVGKVSVGNKSIQKEQSIMQLGNQLMVVYAKLPKSPNSVMVTRADRGLGLALVKEFLKKPDIQIIIATANNVAAATALKEIIDPRLKIVELDQTSDESIKRSYEQVEKIVGDRGLNLLVNNEDAFRSYSLKPGKEISRKTLIEQFNCNTFGVVVLTQTYLPLLMRASALHPDETWGINRAAVCMVSSILGSISLNQSESMDLAGYIASKSALSQFTKTFANDWQREHILVTAFCGGWGMTAMEGELVWVKPEVKAERLVRSFYRLNQSHNGLFYNRNLKPIPY
ncbi:hypothetical protein WR25_12690 [Diploscapter pachys]|uniref:Ketoreductase (KR) domain-containing protein n=1 Tax=Diploscapter pachys TaxID=2018661 RepID=A0A2A2J3R9_9BILA|nr:hypothetical protein WR25_12690 [Diploscapter pachys]